MAERLNGGTPQEHRNLPQTPEMKITGVEVSEYRNGIPLSGWESVVGALNTFATGRTKRGRATQRDLEDNLANDHGAMGLGIYLLATAGIDRNAFVEEMLQEAQSALKGRAHWERHYDYDGMGTSFFKTTVEIDKLPEVKDGYLLGLHAAYVGKEVEDGLAETLGTEQGLQWKSVNVGLAPEGNQFRVDFSQVVDRLQPVIAGLTQPKGRKRITGLDVANYFMSTNEWREPATNFVLELKNGVEVTLDLGRVERRFEYRNGEIVADNWRQEGSVLTGLLDRDYEDESKFVPPSFVVSMHRYSKERYNRLPAIDPKMKATMNELASRIASAFGTTA